MTPPIFELANADAAVRALLAPLTPSNAKIRLSPFGIASQGVVKPYAVWQLIGGEPENYLADVPDVDETTTQVDVYAETSIASRNIAIALRDVFQQHAYITSWVAEQQDADTKLYRTTFHVDWITPR